MEPELVDFLEERRDNLRDPDLVSMNGFEDADLAMYPAVRIPEIDLTIDECEVIANNLIRMLASHEPQLVAEAARALPVLAYNTLMNPRDKEQVPFFRRFPESSFTESWLRTNGVSSVDLRGLCEPRNGNENSTDPKLELIKLNASDFQRRSSIGAWAFCHLRAVYYSSGTILHYFIESRVISPRKGEKFSVEKVYGFPSSYRFPFLSYETYTAFNEEIKANKSGELLYLFYRAAIVLDSIFNDTSHQIQKNLLMESVFGGELGLRYGGLAVWNWARAAARKLDIPIVQLCADLEWALKDPRWLEYSPTSLKTVDTLREFYFRYEEAAHSRGTRSKSRYYMYAHVVNHYYFYYFCHMWSKELSHAFMKLAGRYIPSKSESERKYRIWGELIAEKIQEKYAGRRFLERW